MQPLWLRRMSLSSHSLDTESMLDVLGVSQGSDTGRGLEMDGMRGAHFPNRRPASAALLGRRAAAIFGPGLWHSTTPRTIQSVDQSFAIQPAAASQPPSGAPTPRRPRPRPRQARGCSPVPISSTPYMYICRWAFVQDSRPASGLAALAASILHPPIAELPGNPSNMPKSCGGSPPPSQTPPPCLSAPDPQPSTAHSAFAAKVALLHKRFSSGTLAGGDGGSGHPPAKRQRLVQTLSSVHVPSCCECGDTERSGWCSAEVAIPPIEWAAVMRAVGGPGAIGVGQDGTLMLPGSVPVRVVVRPEQLPAALRALRSSMQDTVVAIDMEWQPDGIRGQSNNKVAMLQLASSSMAVLVRISRMGFTLPPSLAAFLRCGGGAARGAGDAREARPAGARMIPCSLASSTVLEDL